MNGEKKAQTKAQSGKKMPAAIIDIGSNTTRLLVAERTGDGLRELLSQRTFTRMSNGLGDDGSISEKKIAAVTDTVCTQIRLAEVMHSARVRAVATAATRDAPNGDELLRQIHERCGLDVDLLSEADEARYAFLGATRSLPDDSDAMIAVIDVGGGSTEVAIGTLAEGVRWSTSFHIGSGVVADRYMASDPPAALELDAARAAVATVFEDFTFPKPDLAIAIGGSASSLRRITGSVLEHETMERAIRTVTRHTGAEVADEFGLDIERVTLLPAGIMILEQISDQLGLPLRIGKGGLREGILLEMLATKVA
ncbi:MAG: hypothetical protein HZB14_09180 [Actinobacteria bacterium]|nr:hypothetical protein [Actinomycetota bacterium]